HRPPAHEQLRRARAGHPPAAWTVATRGLAHAGAGRGRHRARGAARGRAARRRTRDLPRYPIHRLAHRTSLTPGATRRFPSRCAASPDWWPRTWAAPSAWSWCAAWWRACAIAAPRARRSGTAATAPWGSRGRAGLLGVTILCEGAA